MDMFDEIDLPFGLALFMAGLHRGPWYAEHDQDPWAGRAEKSAAAIRREDEARDKFDYLRGQMDLALHENTATTIGLACHEKSKSPLKLLPNDVMTHVLEFAGCMKSTRRNGLRAHAEKAAAARTGPEIFPFAGWRYRGQGENAPDETLVNLADASLFKPGSKIAIPFAKPGLHLTGPCYRDLRRHVKNYANWDIRRKSATLREKMECKGSRNRKGKVYFINVIYTVPGYTAGKRKRGASTATAPVTAAGVGTSKSPPELLLSPGTQERATSALQAAVQSAASDVDGSVDPEIFQRALDAGYSKHFILGKVNDHLGSLEGAKLPAKKIKPEEEKRR